MNPPRTILVVDDDASHRTMLQALLGEWGYRVAEADDGATAIEAVHKRFFDLVLMDVRMLRVSGLQALEEIRAFNPALPVIIMTAYSSIESAVEALRKGAYDYLTKPLDFEKLKVTLRRAMEHIALREENRTLKETLGRQFDRGRIIGSSPAMVRLLDTVARVAPSEATVLIHGESGTGKELIAGAIHFNSHRKQGPFVGINCAALTETLLESELFGHEKGAFTGADRRKDGCFHRAHGGSIFLDEVSEMSSTMQAKLLRVIQEREVTRVGGDRAQSVDVRVICATNKDLQQLTAAGAFREDLYYRLNVVGLHIPPLRERKEDVPLLAQHFLETFGSKNSKALKGYTPRAMDAIVRHEWPGNVRELMNAVERGVVLAQTEYLDLVDLRISDEPVDEQMDVPAPDMDLGLLEKAEMDTILATLRSAGGNKSKAARQLGITRKTLHSKLKKYGLVDGGD
ncbi:MAG: transcriptional regulator [Deltaproteobacteria bacterium SG8_13]|nr:MAG: transcriptional regulator [Deltaproteobacteria bacterium SG8_13]